MSLPNSLFSTTSLPKPQFRAVVLCGYGSDLYPLVEPVSANDSDEDGNQQQQHTQGKQGQTKALLPVAGKRMVDWVLEKVEEAGVFGELYDFALHGLQRVRGKG